MMDHNPLRFKSMSIDRATYGEDKDKLKCIVRTDRYDTALDIKIPDDVTVEIMKLISPVISASVHQSLLDVARDHENWLIADQEAQDAKQIEDAKIDDDGEGEGQSF